MQFIKDINEKNREFRGWISRESEVVLADLTHDKLCEFEKKCAEKVSEFNKLCADAKVAIKRQKSLEALAELETTPTIDHQHLKIDGAKSDGNRTPIDPPDDGANSDGNRTAIAPIDPPDGVANSDGNRTAIAPIDPLTTAPIATEIRRRSHQSTPSTVLPICKSS